MPVSVDLKRLAFRQLYASAKAQSQTLGAALAAAVAPSLAAALAGKQVIEAQADGVVTKYQLPPSLSASTPDVAAMWGQLYDLYDLATQPVTSVPPGGGITAEEDTDTAPSAAIYAWILGRLKVVRSFSTDHSASNLR